MARRTVAVVVAAVVVALLLSLGTWQLYRLSWKSGLIETMEARLAGEPMALGDALLLPAGEQEWTPVVAEGRFMPRNFALYRIKADSNPGYHILTPLLLDDGHYVLVNRGALRADSFKLALEAVSSAPDEVVTVTGVMRPGETPTLFTNDNDPAGEAWYWIDLDAAGETAGVALLPVVIHADEDPTDAALEGGQARFDPPNRHLEYAITWYLLAGAAAVVAFLRLRRRDDNGDSA
ncbi:MAG: SURF1 family protein [Rhodospirillales bacterium]|nr:SURF1 family protein [Rhodospirillales bacterium]